MIILFLSKFKDKMKKVILGCLMALGFLAGKAWGETPVSGNVSGNWTAGGSPYIVTADFIHHNKGNDSSVSGGIGRIGAGIYLSNSK